ncbi:MAG: OmpH family outer membrane protein [Verrucomicrobiota bacterium]|nr:OmpH family outer membrane protein [Verrucomicrobiota bacterium]
MKKIFGKFLLTLGVALFLATNVHAQIKIGIIDLRKVFDGYYKTKQADANLKDEAADLDKQRKDMVDNFKKGEEEWKKLLDKSNDQAVSAAEREKSKTAAEKKLLELKETEQTVGQFERSARAKLDEKRRRKRDQILVEIREIINTKSKTEGYSLVIDTAAESFNNTPIVLFTNGANDLTDPVLSQLNASAPSTPTPVPSSPKEEKKKTK